MADYRLTATDIVIRTADQASIPNDPGNRDRIAYDAWLADGGVPDPHVPPAPPPVDDPVQDVVLFEHENRIRSLEGVPPIEIGDFRRRLQG
ncbi:MAG TPA: hypothetical protein VHT00_14315 [Stellaceae bacterium]|nr:hypothetical protein [Stellaceae bacterium]